MLLSVGSQSVDRQLQVASRHHLCIRWYSQPGDALSSSARISLTTVRIDYVSVNQRIGYLLTSHHQFHDEHSMRNPTMWLVKVPKVVYTAA